MSLVAYNASDESDGDGDNSDESLEVMKPNKKSLEANRSSTDHISDEDEYETVSSTSVSTNAATITSSAPVVPKIGDNFQDLLTFSPSGSESVSALKDLPASLSSTRAAMKEDDLEDEVKPKPVEIANALKPPSKRKQPVKINIPSLEETQIDEDGERKKKPTASMTKSGLFSLLPPPVHSAKKEINRPLIPHTLTKRPQTAQSSSQNNSHNHTKKLSVPSSSTNSSASSAIRKVALNVAMYGSDSDDEEEVSASNFFSLDSLQKSSPSKDAVESDSSKRLQSEEVSSSVVSSKLIVSGDLQAGQNNSLEDESGIGEEDKAAAASPEPEPGAINDAPLDFSRVSSSRLWSSPSSSSFQGYLGAVGISGPVASSQVASASAQYNMVVSEVNDDGAQESVADEDLKQFMSEKEFQRLSGKRKRGLEEAINFVDANVDDYVDPSEVSKHLTEETEYVSHKNKDNMPTAQQRRKKQITYLAYQAKERELELKNTWAQNRITKKQTQSKYGF